MNKLFKFIWSLWGLLGIASTTVIFFLVFTFILLFNKKGAWRITHEVSRIWAAFLMFLLGIRYKIHGTAYLKKDEAYIIVANHSSQLDIPMCALATKNNAKYLAKHELGKIPLLGWIIRNFYITVKRKNASDRSKSMQIMSSWLQKGVSIIIYPEGTRNRTNEPVAKLYDGAFRLAIKSNKPLAVLSIKGANKRLSTQEYFSLNPGKIELIWEKPIETANYSEKDIPALKDKVREIWIQNLTENNEK